MAITENTRLIREASAYVIALYHELTEENGFARTRHPEPGRRLHPRRSGAEAGGVGSGATSASSRSLAPIAS